MAKNLKELNEILKNYIGTALILTQWDIREILEKKVEEYYDEYQPVLYERTWKLRNSLQCSNIKFEKKGVSCTVGWDNYYIAMRYTGGATGEQVLYWFNDKSHGGRVQGEHKFWDDLHQEINSVTDPPHCHFPLPHILNLLYIFLKSEIPYPRNKDNHLKQSFFHPLFSAFCATLVSIINDFLLNANSAAVFLPRHLYLAVLFCDLY